MILDGDRRGAKCREVSETGEIDTFRLSQDALAIGR